MAEQLPSVWIALADADVELEAQAEAILRRYRDQLFNYARPFRNLPDD